MLLKVPANFSAQIVDVDGKTYAPDSNGNVNIPDGKVSDNLWGYGFTITTQQPAAKAASSNS